MCCWPRSGALYRMKDWLRTKAMVWTTSLALSLFTVSFFTPAFLDLLFDAITVGLVWLAGQLAKA